VTALLCGALIQAAEQQGFPIAGVPQPLPGTPVSIAEPAAAIQWTEPIPAAAIASPIIAGDAVIVAHLPGIVAAYHRADRRVVWRKDLQPVQPLASDGTLLFVATGDAIHAVRIADGSPGWKVESPSPTAPLLVKDGWIIVAAGGALTARRTGDGTTVWTTASGVQREAPGISGDVLFVPLVEGRLVARDLLTGQERWQTQIDGSPGEPLVVGEDIFVGGSDKRFYCLDAGSGEIDWPKRVGAQIRGRAATDGQRIFFTALDHLVRAVDRITGAQLWQTPVPFRPLQGPVASGGLVFIAGAGSEVVALRSTDGKIASTTTFPGRMAFGPAYSETADGVVIAVVTGGLEESWQLSVTNPIAGTRASGK
jgi:outer membrane protein assembly factor BamB